MFRFDLHIWQLKRWQLNEGDPDLPVAMLEAFFMSHLLDCFYQRALFPLRKVNILHQIWTDKHESHVDLIQCHFHFLTMSSPLMSIQNKALVSLWKKAPEIHLETRGTRGCRTPFRISLFLSLLQYHSDQWQVSVHPWLHCRQELVTAESAAVMWNIKNRGCCVVVASVWPEWFLQCRTPALVEPALPWNWQKYQIWSIKIKIK